MKYTWITKDGQRKQVPTIHIQRFQDEGWTMMSDTVKKKSPSKPKAKAAVTKQKPKMTITKASADVIKDAVEEEVFGSQQEE
tara:strand:- start:4536 stop:4781 length:246 start_codon:yes stop_codon:yes gene_type:complete